MNSDLEVLIRFNTNFNNEDPHSKEWRVIVNGTEKLCNTIEIECSSKTSKNFIEGVGFKWHIQCNASELIFENDSHYDDDTHFNKIVIR